MSVREAAREIGISHSTLIAAREGSRKTDVETALAIAKWLGVPLSTLIVDADKEAQERRAVYQAIDMVLQAAPELEQVFLTAAKELEQGVLQLSDFRDIVEYATYKIRIRREQQQQH